MNITARSVAFTFAIASLTGSATASAFGYALSYAQITSFAVGPDIATSKLLITDQNEYQYGQTSITSFLTVDPEVFSVKSESSTSAIRYDGWSKAMNSVDSRLVFQSQNRGTSTEWLDLTVYLVTATQARSDNTIDFGKGSAAARFSILGTQTFQSSFAQSASGAKSYSRVSSDVNGVHGSYIAATVSNPEFEAAYNESVFTYHIAIRMGRSVQYSLFAGNYEAATSNVPAPGAGGVFAMIGLGRRRRRSASARI